MTYNPNDYPKLRHAWKAVYELLDNNPKGCHWVPLKEAARKSPAGIKSTTARSLISELRRKGLIQKDGTRYFLTELGRQLAPPKDNA